jgi:hypothetical protein
MAIEYLIYGLSPLIAYYLVTRKTLGPLFFIAVLILAVILLSPLWFTNYVYTYYIFELFGRFILLASLSGLLIDRIKSFKHFRKIAYNSIGLSITLSLLITAVIFFAEAMGTTNITLQEWKTENYRITHYSSIAWAGQPSEYIYLKEYKAGGLLNTTVGYLYQNDIPKESDCKIGFTNYIFDKCTNTITKKE